MSARPIAQQVRHRQIPEVRRLREAGCTLTEIGNAYGYSRQYIHQLLRREYIETIEQLMEPDTRERFASGADMELADEVLAEVPACLLLRRYLARHWRRHVCGRPLRRLRRGKWSDEAVFAALTDILRAYGGDTLVLGVSLGMVVRKYYGCRLCAVKYFLATRCEEEADDGD